MKQKKTQSDKVRLHVEISKDVDNALRTYASAKRVGMRALVEQALISFLNPAADSNRDVVISKRLQKVDRQLLALMETNRLQEETLALFIQVSLGLLPEPYSQNDKQDFKDKVNRRWSKFIEQLTDIMAERSRGIYSYLPKDFIASAKDFPEPPSSLEND